MVAILDLYVFFFALFGLIYVCMEGLILLENVYEVLKSCYQWYHRFDTEVINKVSRKFDAKVMTEHKECVICFTEFDRDSKVVFLPCDKRHYFHAKCIE